MITIVRFSGKLASAWGANLATNLGRRVSAYLSKVIQTVNNL